MFGKLSINVMMKRLFFLLTISSLHVFADSSSLSMAAAATAPNPIYSALEPDNDILGR